MHWTAGITDQSTQKVIYMKDNVSRFMSIVKQINKLGLKASNVTCGDISVDFISDVTGHTTDAGVGTGSYPVEHDVPESVKTFGSYAERAILDLRKKMAGD